MAANISELLRKAEALPAADTPEPKWTEFAPIIQTLMDKGHSVWSATQWLVSEGAIPEDKKRSAYHSILQHRQRAKK